jgi:hypothetical protein
MTNPVKNGESREASAGLTTPQTYSPATIWTQSSISFSCIGS